MVKAYVLIRASVGDTPEVLTGLQEMSGVDAVAVTGPYDVIAIVQAEDIDALGKLVAGSIQAVPGITRTLTCPVIRL